MKLYWKMPDGLKVHYHQELKDYEKEIAKGNLQAAWRHLERAHILGQPWPARAFSCPLDYAQVWAFG
jgi:hypothetical protein